MRKEKNEERTGAAVSAKRIAVGFVIGCILFFGLTAVFAAVGLKSDMDEEKYRWFAWGTVAASALAAGFITVRPLRKNGLLLGGITGIAAAIPALIAISMAAGKGAGSKELLAAAVFTCCGALGGVGAANRKVKRKY